ncbi:hypothetical protein RRG08_029657 [Elysia crispata]|uniref:Uncharacterized protein n=1 Tax=Elysia crispata TaxID=231223 RepID=A0AAE0XPA4_9GAST|nr:hypothetical protein RRG08_029657 [Elysia crispata]
MLPTVSSKQANHFHIPVKDRNGTKNSAVLPPPDQPGRKQANCRNYVKVARKLKLSNMTWTRLMILTVASTTAKFLTTPSPNRNIRS